MKTIIRLYPKKSGYSTSEFHLSSKNYCNCSLITKHFIQIVDKIRL